MVNPSNSEQAYRYDRHQFQTDVPIGIVGWDDSYPSVDRAVNSALNSASSTVDPVAQLNSRLNLSGQTPIAPRCEFKLGDEVDGLCTLPNGTKRWFAGEIVAVHDMSGDLISDSNSDSSTNIVFTVRYKDGDVHTYKPADEVRRSRIRNRSKMPAEKTAGGGVESQPGGHSLKPPQEPLIRPLNVLGVLSTVLNTGDSDQSVVNNCQVNNRRVHESHESKQKEFIALVDDKMPTMTMSMTVRGEGDSRQEGTSVPISAFSPREGTSGINCSPNSVVSLKLTNELDSSKNKFDRYGYGARQGKRSVESADYSVERFPLIDKVGNSESAASKQNNSSTENTPVCSSARVVEMATRKETLLDISFGDEELDLGADVQTVSVGSGRSSANGDLEQDLEDTGENVCFEIPSVYAKYAD